MHRSTVLCQFLLIVFKGGQALETSVGAMSKDDLEKKLQKVL